MPDTTPAGTKPGGLEGTAQDVKGYAETASGIAKSVDSVWKSVGSLFGSSSSRPSWQKADSVAGPLARSLVTYVVDKVGADKIPAVFALYAQKLKEYIANSAHSDPDARRFYVEAVEKEAVQMSGGFRLDAFAFDRTDQVQLAWAVWLHAMWLYGNTDEDEIANGGATAKFHASLGPTLLLAISEKTGVKIIPPESPGVGYPAPSGETTVATKMSSIFQSPWLLLALGGAAFYFVLKQGRR